MGIDENSEYYEYIQKYAKKRGILFGPAAKQLLFDYIDSKLMEESKSINLTEARLIEILNLNIPQETKTEPEQKPKKDMLKNLNKIKNKTE